jgi:hypothetical protein
MSSSSDIVIVLARSRILAFVQFITPVQDKYGVIDAGGMSGGRCTLYHQSDNLKGLFHQYFDLSV